MASHNPDTLRGDKNAAKLEPSSEEYTWRIENFSRIAETKLISTEFEIDTYTWRLLLFPKGTGSQDSGDYMAVCLNYPEASFTPLMVCPKARFEVTAVNQAYEKNSVKREASHMFTGQAADWGFTEFIRLQDALNSESGFVLNDTLIIKIAINVQKKDNMHTISRKQTGFAGLKNQGSTGYLNAVLQYLYHIPYLRRAVYQMPTFEMDKTRRCVPIALQSLFYKLQYQDSNVSTRHLTNSFGWGEEEVLLQHDVQEMLAMLRGNLDENMKGTDVDGTMPDLFAGRYSHYIQCLDVDHTVSRDQPFMDISLDVHNCKDIYESLEKFCADEKLDGPNKYRTENFGLQDARRFARFETFPPVLQLHLQRFDYDYVRNVMFKNNSRYEFYDELDLDCKGRAFLSETSDKTAENKYRLHCVFTHTGGAAGGTYTVFVKSGDKWYKFEDEVVTEVTSEAAISDQFGGEDTNVSSTSASGPQTPTKSTAYILVYVRSSDWDRIMCNCGKEDIEEPIRKSFEAEQVAKQQRQKEKQDAHLHVAIKLATEKNLSEQLAEKYYFELADFDRLATYRLHKKTLFKDFKETVSKDFGIPPQLQRFWLWKQRQNGTMRLDKPLDTTMISVETVLDLKHFKEKTMTPTIEKTALLTIQLFLESPETENALHQLQPNELVLFVKLYNPESSKLSHIGRLFLDKGEPLSVALKHAACLAGLPPEADITGFQVKHEPELVCSDLVPTETAEKSQLHQGDVIVIQERVTEDKQMQHDYVFPTARAFLESCGRVM